MANLGAYQSPWVRIQRLLNAQRQGFESLTDTMAGMIDLEAHQRLRERPLEAMQRFREVEQRQQPSVRGGRGPMPSLPAPGGPQYEPGGRVLPAEAAPYLREMLPRRQREAAGILPVPGEPGLEPTGGLIPTGEQRMAIGQRALQQQGPTPFVPSGGMLGMAMPVLEQADFPRQLVKEKLIEPVVPDFAMKIPGEALGAALPPGVRDVVGAVGALGGPEVPDVTITDEFVEEAASWVLDPLNVLPVIGWGPDIMRAAKAGRPALKALLKKTPQAKAWLDDAIRAGERGGPRVPGVGPEDVARVTPEPELGGFPGRFKGRARAIEGGPPREPPPTGPPLGVPEPTWESAIDKLNTGLRTSGRRLARSEITRSAERGQRIAEYQRIIQVEREAGTPSSEAFHRANAALTGEYAKFEAPAFGLTPQESEAIWTRAAEFDYGRKAFNQKHVADALLRIEQGEPLRRFEINALKKVYGPKLANTLNEFAKTGSNWDKLLNSITVPRTILSSMDVSYPLRQGFKVSVRHP